MADLENDEVIGSLVAGFLVAVPTGLFAIGICLACGVGILRTIGVRRRGGSSPISRSGRSRGARPIPRRSSSPRRGTRTRHSAGRPSGTERGGR
jgi:hypothetical protein